MAPEPAAAARPGAAERASAGRPGQFKATQRREAEAARRRAALAAQQSEARADRIADVRRIAMEALLAGEANNDVEDEVEVEEEDDEEDEGAADAEMGGQKDRGKKIRRLRRLHRTLFFARQFQLPDWLLEPPQDLASSWLVQVRPEGDRCLLLSDGGCVHVRKKNGTILERYKDCRLPQGLTILDVVCVEPLEEEEGAPQPHGKEPKEPSDTGARMGVDEAPMEVVAPGSSGAAAAATAEEAAAAAEDAGGADVEMGGREGRGRGRGGQSRGRGGKAAGKGRRARPVGDRRYAVCDVLAWGDSDLASADAECRMFWLESRFAEFSDKPSRRARTLQLVPAKAVTPEVLSQAYHVDPGYVKDSLLFLHREGGYGVSEPATPLALLWRDRQVSRYVVDTPDKTGATLPERQAIVLEVRGKGYLRTADRAVVAQLTAEQLKELEAMAQGAQGSGSGTKAYKGLARFEAQSVDLAARRLSIAKVVCPVPARSRVWPDSWGRIAFQHLHRQGKTDRISFQALMRAAIGDAAPVAADEEK